MFTSNPFTDLLFFLHPLFMQVYIVLMIFAVVIGTLIDMLHKSSAIFFLRQWRHSNAIATKRLSSSDSVSLAARTLVNEVVTSGEFCKVKRRISHLLMSYGLVIYLVTTIVMVFGYPEPAMYTPVILPILWNTGILMVLAGGYWFFFFLRVNVAHEGHSPFHLMRADLFIVSLLASVSFALIWEIVQMTDSFAATRIVFGIYIFFTTVLFVSVPWSKFAHMFYKPAAALQKRVERANGSSDLPNPSDASHIRR
jgi:hypothetical protein